MTGRFQEVVKGALAAFVAEISAAAEHEAIEALRSAFARASRPPGDAVAAVGALAPPPEGRAHRSADRHATARIARVAVRERIVACIREHPGWDPVQLGRSLGNVPAKLRRHLRELVNSGVIRFEETRIGVGALRRRLYYVREPANGVHARHEPAAIPTVPPAVHVEAVA